MAVRSAMPWPLRWVIAALLLGFCAAIALWAFQFGKVFAGLDINAKEELAVAQTEIAGLRAELEKARSVSNTSQSLLTAEKAAQDVLSGRIKQLESENMALRDDLGFFQNLIPATGAEGISIRSVQIERIDDTHAKWQVLVIQPTRNAPEFSGTVEITLTGTVAGKPWTSASMGGPQKLSMKQYRRLDGIIDIPASAVLKSATAKVMDGSATRATQTIKL